MATPLEVTIRYFGALGQGDMATVSSLLAESCVWHQPGDNQFSGQHTGPEAIGQLMGSMMKVSGGTFSVIGTGDPMVNATLVAAPVRFTGQRDGVSLDTGGIDLLTIENDKIVRVDLFTQDGSSEDEFWGK